ncbi:capsid assembly scaffolding protein Gp46 family protein [Clostridium butyricum]
MKKQDLLTKLEEINEDIEITEEILGFAKPKEFNVNDITLEQFKNVLETNQQINGYYQSTLDSKVSKGINTFKEKTMPSLIEEEIKKRDTSNLTPEQLQLKELQAQLDAMKLEKEQAELLNANANKLKENGLDTGLAKYIKSDEDITFFKDLISNSVQAGIQEKLGDSNYKPPTTTGDVNTVTKQEFNKMGYKEKLKLYNDNKELYDELNK